MHSTYDMSIWAEILILVDVRYVRIYSMGDSWDAARDNIMSISPCNEEHDNLV